MHYKWFQLLFLIGITASLMGCPFGNTSTPGRRYSFSEIVQVGNFISQTTDGGYFIAGDIQYPNRRPQVLALKVAGNGDIEWVSDTTSPFSESVYYRSTKLAVNARDGGFILAGHDESNLGATEPSARLRVTKLGPYGDIQWDNIYGIGLVLPAVVIELSNGEIAIAVRDHRGVELPRGGYVRITEDGEFVESFELSSPLSKPTAILEALDGSLVLAGAGEVEESGSLDVTAAKVNPDTMEELWFQGLDVNGGDEVRAMSETLEGDLILAGKHSFGVFLIRFSSDGEVLQVRDDILPLNDESESDDIWDVALTPEGNIAIAGQELSARFIAPFLPPAYHVRNFIALLDPNGDMIWNTALGDAEPHGITNTAQGTFMVTGKVGDNLFIAEVDANGNVLN